MAELRAPTQTIVLRLPLATVEERMPHVRQQAGVPARGRSGPGALFSDFLRQVWTELEQSGAGGWKDHFDKAVWPLLAMAYAGKRPALEANRREEPRRALSDAVARDLTDPAHARDTTVTDVAYDVGFNDLSSFCRAFRPRFSAGPRDHRSGAKG